MHHSTDKDALRAECAKAQSFEELAALGLRELAKFSGEAEVLEGPLSTGGLGSLEKNFERYGRVFRGLQDEGRSLFDYAPYEAGVLPLKLRWKEEPSHTGYCMPILEEFYRPLFDSGMITRAWFIPGWEDSFGSTWAHNELARRNVPILHLTEARIRPFIVV